MKAIMFVIALAACGSPPPAQKPGGSGGGGGSTPGTTSEAHRSRHVLVKQAVTALAAGDVDSLVALSAAHNVFASSFECEKVTAENAEGLVREHAKTRAATSKGVKVEVLYMGKLELDEKATQKIGAKDGGCTAKVNYTVHTATVRLKVDRNGKSSEKDAKFELVEVADLWYLGKLPDINAKSRSEETLEKIGEFSKRMCECKDKACADKVNDDYTNWGRDMAKNYSRDDDDAAMYKDRELMNKMTDYVTKYSECYTKLVMSDPSYRNNPCGGGGDPCGGDPCGN